MVMPGNGKAFSAPSDPLKELALANHLASRNGGGSIDKSLQGKSERRRVAGDWTSSSGPCEEVDLTNAEDVLAFLEDDKVFFIFFYFFNFKL